MISQDLRKLAYKIIAFQRLMGGNGAFCRERRKKLQWARKGHLDCFTRIYARNTGERSADGK
jgi:hypothetical protein